MTIHDIDFFFSININLFRGYMVNFVNAITPLAIAAKATFVLIMVNANAVDVNAMLDGPALLVIVKLPMIHVLLQEQLRYVLVM